MMYRLTIMKPYNKVQIDWTESQEEGGAPAHRGVEQGGVVRALTGQPRLGVKEIL